VRRTREERSSGCKRAACRHGAGRYVRRLQYMGVAGGGGGDPVLSAITSSVVFELAIERAQLHLGRAPGETAG
jgi:hypothetical protein